MIANEVRAQGRDIKLHYVLTSLTISDVAGGAAAGSAGRSAAADGRPTTTMHRESIVLDARKRRAGLVKPLWSRLVGNNIRYIQQATVICWHLIP